MYLAVSATAVIGSDFGHTMKLKGIIQGLEVLILVDLGSSHSFVSSNFAAQMTGITDMHKPVIVQVADGGQLACSQQLLAAQWSVQQCNFATDFRVLNISAYDLILGVDWLGAHSPMKVHWGQNWIVIPYKGSQVLLHGLASSLPTRSVVEVAAVNSQSPKFTELGLPEIFIQLLSKFESVFMEPTGLPPSRDCDDTIPLVASAVPFQIHPYRYPPAIKDEVERQNGVMLKSGIIQHNSSPFSSSALLVMNKDNSWRFCVDFRHLNAITIKSTFPVPVIEELLDELGHASWFTSLDLTAGYHQILLQPSDTHKTAFQTHSGHYEFRVMAFGLTGAPSTFPKAMNVTLAPLLRRCVLVFFDDILVCSTSFEEHLRHVRSVLELLRRDQWQIKLSKCLFVQTQLTYLGHVISAAGVATDPGKIKAVATWSTPTSVKEL